MQEKPHSHIDEFNFLKNCFKSKCPHSWIFYGPEGVGKYQFTIDFIKVINKGINLHQCLFEINNTEISASINDVRDLINQTTLTNSYNAKLKTFILIHSLDLLNINATNALLKMIEEPPGNTIIIILASNLRVIPKTIISRCLKLKLNANNSEHFNNLKKHNLDNYLLCNHNPKVLDILNNKEGEGIKKTTLNILESRKLNIDEFLNLYNEINNDFKTYFLVVTHLIFYKLKKKILTDFQNFEKTRYALVYFDFLKNISLENLKIDKKKTLYLIFSEFFKYKLNINC